jgi:hypothetical protein
VVEPTFGSLGIPLTILPIEWMTLPGDQRAIKEERHPVRFHRTLSQVVMRGTDEWATFDYVIDTAWSKRAACAGMDGRLFFPTVHSRSSLRWVLPRSICNRCPVKAECLADTLKYEAERPRLGGQEERYGMAGGMTPDERTALVTGRQPPPPDPIALPCGHSYLRWNIAPDGRCKTCRDARRRERRVMKYPTHLEAARARGKTYRFTHREAERQRMRQYREKKRNNGKA